MEMHEQARLALAAKASAERHVALAPCPPWRHAAFAGVVAALVATPAVPIGPRFAVLAAIFVAMALIVRSDRRRLGLFINGYRRGRTRRVALPMLAVVLGLYGASVHAALGLGRPAASLALAVVSFVAGWVGSVIWQGVFRRELGV